ncbi:MAG: alcohol dehydrogenase catalytic domain-containing protein [Bacteroidetes bacterium]|nr:alcohol dehydrogenase catalytic domain-containing protein [Bacteroidota bacterium]
MEKLLNRIGRVIEPGKVDFISCEVEELKADQVLIKIVSSAICGSDLHIFKGKHPSAPLPVTIGHEFSGDIIAVGTSVSALKVGDRVTVEPVLTCGECRACKTGDYGYCEKISYTYRNGDGAMANYITVDADHVYTLPSYLSYDSAALIEPLSVAVHAVRRADIKLGEKVLILGAGSIGLLITALCRKMGATEIVVVDFSSQKLAMAKTLGATAVINSRETDPFLSLNEITNGSGVDKSFECVGVQDTLLQAMMGLRKNGLATILGIFEDPEVTIPVSRFVTHEIKVQGSQGYCWDFPTALEIAKEIKLDELITHTFVLDDLQKALETCLDRTSGAIKVIIKP